MQYRMVPQKTWVAKNLWPDLKILEAFLMGLEVSFLGDSCILGVHISFQQVSESQICPEESNFSELMGTSVIFLS